MTFLTSPLGERWRTTTDYSFSKFDFKAPRPVGPRPIQSCLRPIGLGDLVRAFRALCLPDTTEAERRRVLHSLGLMLAESQTPLARPEPPPPSDRIPPIPEAPPPVTSPATGADGTGSAPEIPIEPTPSPNAEPEILEPVGYVAADSPVRLLEKVMELESYDPDRHAQPMPAPNPLLPVPRDRAILAAMSSTWHPGRDIDLERVTRLLALGRPVALLPRRPRKALSRQVQVLLDLSQGMLPFRRDQEELLRTLATVVGRESLETLYFMGCPLSGSVLHPRGAARRYSYPLPGTPVLIVSDLGYAPTPVRGSRRLERAWVEFSRNCHQRGCPAVVLNPYARRRWSSTPDRNLVVLEWDLRLSVREALQPLLNLRRDVLRRSR